MPPRSEAELDPVTLHNVALMHMDDNPNEHLPKLNFLLTAPSSPPQTFSNLLLIYCKYQYYDIAADVLAENTHLTYSHLEPVRNSISLEPITNSVFFKRACSTF
jgi:tetratricopeptide repeat protein 30